MKDHLRPGNGSSSIQVHLQTTQHEADENSFRIFYQVDPRESATVRNKKLVHAEAHFIGAIKPDLKSSGLREAKASEGEEDRKASGANKEDPTSA